jgi:hypothetical protein
MLQAVPSAAEHCDPCAFEALPVIDDPRSRTLEAAAVKDYVKSELKSPGAPVEPRVTPVDAVNDRHEAASKCAHMIVTKACELYRYKREGMDDIAIVPKPHLRLVE